MGSAHFLADSIFTTADFLCKNSDLTQKLRGEKKQKNFLKLGVDFTGQTRYNVCLYGKLEEGGAIHAQH